MSTEIRVLLNDEEMKVLKDLQEVMGRRMGRGRHTSVAQVIRMLIILEGVNSGVLPPLSGDVRGDDEKGVK